MSKPHQTNIKKAGHPRYKYALTFWEVVDGKRVKRVKYSNNLEKLQVAKSKLDRKIRSQGDELVTLSNDERTALTMWRTMQSQNKNEKTKLSQIVEDFAIKLALKNGRTLVELYDHTLAKRVAEGKKERTIRDLRTRLKRFVEDLGEDRPAASVEVEDVDEWLGQLMSRKNKDSELEPVSETTRLNYRRNLHTMFAEGVARKWLVENPVSESIKPKAEVGEVGILTPSQAAKVLRTATGEMQVTIAIQLFAGLRHSEACSLTWADIDLEQGYLKPKVTKTRARLIPICDALRGFLEESKDKSGKVWSFTESNHSKKLAEVFKLAKTPHPDNALRHSFCSYRVAETQNVEQVALEAGNSPKTIREHYLKLVTPAKAGEFFAIRKG